MLEGWRLAWPSAVSWPFIMAIPIVPSYPRRLCRSAWVGFSSPSVCLFVCSITNKKDGYRQQKVRQRQKLISIIDYDVCTVCYDFLLVRHCNYSSILYHLRVIWLWIISWSWPENWLRGLSRSLKLVPFKSLGTVSYLPSIVTMVVSAAVVEIFSVKEWPNLEIWVWGPSRSLKKARFDRPCMTFY